MVSPRNKTQRKGRRAGARSAAEQLRGILADNRRGKGRGIYSLCSANRFVIESGMVQAARDENILLVESTSNQVNQFGGYTGQTPLQFVNFVQGVAAEMGFPQRRIVLGGDHLGPHVWRKEPAASAMEKAREMVREYVLAGFTKIHLDTSMACADDKTDQQRALPEEIISARAADLCAAAEEANRELAPRANTLLYVVGTEVPIPGGEEGDSKAPEVTGTKDLAQTLEITKKAFLARGLKPAWNRVIAAVVQPGVEFGDATVYPYDARKARPLSRFLNRAWNGVYEAHSTDYQSREALRQMVLDHFAILKVGPQLTFAFREAVFALAATEREWLSGTAGVSLSDLPETLDRAMRSDPSHWKSYYHGDARDLRLARKYSYSDRARYYWPQAAVSASLELLLRNLSASPAPVSLLSQFLPRQADAVRAGKIENQPAALIRDYILEVLEQYAYACGCANATLRGVANRYAE